MDIAAWLRDLGLERYEGAFLENKVDGAILPKLTGDDLKEIGINAVGDRRRLLDAISSLTAPPTSDVAEHATTGAESVSPRGEAERRQITVMFADMASSTELATRLDPEDLGALMRTYQEHCARIVEGWDGHIAKYMGDGVLAYFGWPRAHEDDPERAVRTGLALTEAIGALRAPTGDHLAVRVGIATGLVMVGEQVGDGTAQESTVAGETPNLAARLQALSAPGTVVVAPGTQRLLHGVFELQDLGEHALKGFLQPVRAWQVVGEAASESRFEARTQDMAPLVGRDDEVEILTRRWRRAREGEGQVVLITGEAGIGKSRLVATLRDLMSHEPHTTLVYQCSPHHTESTLHPVIRQLEHAAGIRIEQSPAEKLERLEALLSDAASKTQVPPLASLLSIPVGSAPTHDAQELRERTFRALVGQLEDLAAMRPVLMVFEDVHWADPSTLDLLDRLVERLESLPVLVLLTTRPGFAAAWTDEPHVTVLNLNRIGRRDSRVLLKSLAGELPDDLIEAITARGDGIPLFIEEISRNVLESRRGDNGNGMTSHAEVPVSLQDSLMARLDRLPTAKPVAQMAAALGRDFSRQMLELIRDPPQLELDNALDELVGAGVLRLRRGSSEPSYVFKHALVQDAAYNSLLRSSRRHLHRRIAETLGGLLTDQPAMLAHHWERAGDLDQALAYRLQAGQRAATRFAVWEAVAQYWHAFDLLQLLPETDATQECHVETLLSVCGLRVFWRNEAERDSALQHIEKALEFACRSGATAHLARLAAFKGNHWQDEPALALATRHAETVGDARLNAYVENLYASYLGKIGQFKSSHAHVERAIQTYADLGDEVAQGLAMAITGRCYYARAGNIERSLVFARRARDIAKATGHPRLTSWLAIEAEPYMYRGLWEQTAEVVERELPSALETGNWGVVLFASSWATIAYVELGRLGDARAMIERAMTIAARRTVYDHYKIFPEIALARLHLAGADPAAGIMAGRRALARAERVEHGLEAGAAHRVLGQIYQVTGDRLEAKTHFERSLEILGTIQSRPELAQSLLAYGRFKRTDDPAGGRRLLNEAPSPVRGHGRHRLDRGDPCRTRSVTAWQRPTGRRGL